MKFALTFVLIFISVVKSQNLEDFQLFSQCDRTVGSGVATCMQFFSPIKFVTDFLKSDKESLCCSHFRHTACISGVRDATRIAKAANLCPDSFADELISTLTDSTVNNYIRKACKTFNTGKCVMDSVGDVVNTIQGFFVPQQQKPVVPQLIQRVPQLIQTVPQLFGRSGGNSYSNDDNHRNHNYGNNDRNHNYGNNDRTSVFNSFREIINTRRTVTTTPNPLIGQSVRDLFDRQYIPEASDIRPVKEGSDENETEARDPLRSLFSGLIDSSTETTEGSGEPSLFDAIGGVLNSAINQNQTNGQNFFSDIFNINDTDSHIVRDITDSLN